MGSVHLRAPGHVGGGAGEHGDPDGDEDRAEGNGEGLSRACRNRFVQQQHPAGGGDDGVHDGHGGQRGGEATSTVGTLGEQKPERSEQGDARTSEQHRLGRPGLAIDMHQHPSQRRRGAESDPRSDREEQ